MAQATHTLGPWSVSAPSGNYIDCPAGHSVAALTFSATDADARLIAAAPELLEALEKVQDWLAGCSTRETMARMVDAAIAKAKGE